MSKEVIIDYFDKLYDKNSLEIDQGEINKRKKFLFEHIEEIEQYYEEAIGHGAPEGDPQTIEEALKAVKISLYKDMLYPDYSQLNPEDKEKVARDNIFIEEHIEDIEKYYEEAIEHGAPEGDSQTIEETLKAVKISIYKKMLYPDYSQLNPEDKEKVARDNIFIEEHIEDIEKYYEEAIGHGAPEGDPQIIEEAIDSIKRSRLITPEKIENLTNGVRLGNFSKGTEIIKEDLSRDSSKENSYKSLNDE